MGKESIQSAVAADHSRDAAQLKAEHGKEMTALKAEEAQALAAQKAEHSKTPGKTGLLAKLTGKEDPVKKAEKQQLKAEIARVEETTKADQDRENAELKAHGSKHMAALGAGAALPAGHVAGGALPAGYVAGGAFPAGYADNQVIAAGIPDNKIYNHATGAKGQAALAGVPHPQHDHGLAAFADNGLGDRHRHHHHDHNHSGFHHGGINQGDFNRGELAPAQAPMVAGAVPVAVMPAAQSAMPLATHGAPMMAQSAMPLASHAPMMAQSTMPLATHGAPMMATNAAPLAMHGAPMMATNAAPMSSGATQPVAVIAPSHSNRL